MAYALTQMPVQIVQILTEPDLLPKFQYLFEKDHGPVLFEDSGTSSDVEPQVDSEDENSLDIVFCEDAEANSDINHEQNSEEEDISNVDIVPCEDQETTCDAKGQVKREVEVLKDTLSCEDTIASFDARVDVNSEEEGSIDIVPCEEEEKVDVDVVSCEESNTTSDVKAEVNNEEEGAIGVASCEEGDVVDAYSYEVLEEPVVPFVVPAAAAVAGIPKCEPRIQELSIPLEKLRFTTNCINKRIELEEDEYIFCSQCDKLRIGNCSVHGSLKWVKEPTDVLVKEGLTKARSTIPSNMDLKTSSIPDAGLGIFAKERFESDVVFGPYWGQKIGVVDVTPSMDQSYMWDIIENGRVTHVVDARDEGYSNWLRFVNCARNDDEQNLVAFQFRGEIYYRSYKTIEPGMELLVWYGDRYACDLDILDKDDSDKIADGPIQCQKCFMVCSGPSSLATHNKFRCQINNEHHLWRCIHCDRSFKTPQSLQRHKNIHKGLKPYACRICGKVFSSPWSRKRHHSLHFNMLCSCKMCGMVFHNTITLGHHETTVHAYKRLSNGKIECTECDKVLANWKCLRQHKKRLPHKNADAFTCKTCGKLFRKKDNLLRHEALHKPSFLAEPYKCQHCGLCFKSGIGLSNHKRIHVSKNVSEGKSDKGGSSQKTASNSVQSFPTKGLFVVRGKKCCTRHVCQICKAPFAYSFNLARHIREKHPRVKIIKCGKCAKVCVSKRELAVHIAMKHETRKYDSKQFSLESVKCSQRNLTLPEYQLLSHTCIYQKEKVNEGTAAQDSESKRTVQASDGKHSIFQRPSQVQTAYSSFEFRCEFCAKGFPSLSLMHRHRAAHFRKKNPTLPVSLGVTSKASGEESPHIYQKKSMGEGATAQESESKRTVQALNVKYNTSQRSSQDETANSSKKFGCEFCAKVFPSLSLMHCHRAVHFRKKNRALLSPFGVSSMKPNKETSRQDTAQPRNGQFRCGVCCKVFPSLRLMHCHKACHFQNKKRVRQHKCHRAENTTSVSWSAVKRVESSAVHCKVCNKSFHKETSLRSHMTHHSRNASQSNHLSLPNPSPKSSKNLAEDKLFKCDICGKEFTSKDSLRWHKRHHLRFGKMQVALPKQGVNANAQKPHVCQVCCESFQSSRSLSQHKRSHAGIKTAFACPFCRKGFSCKRNLLRHKRRQHHRPYKCQRCGEGFPTAQGRLRHSLKHVSVKLDQKCSSSTETDPVKCETLRVLKICCLHCDKRFMTCKGRYKHMRKYHSEESKVGPWKCPHCRTVFQNESAMKKHVKNKHAKRKRSEDQQGCKKEDKDGIETTNSKVAERTHMRSEVDTIAPWKCEFCSKVFQSASGMKKHVKKNHSKRRKSEASRQGCKPKEKDGIKTTNSKATGRTQSWSEWLNIAPWKCQFCSKVFLSVSGVKKHMKKKHFKRTKFEASNQGCKPEEKDGIENNNSKATESTQSWSEWLNIAPWKCQFCSKVCESVSCMQKHVKKRHSNRMNCEALHQVGKPDEKDGIAINSSKVTERTQSLSEPEKIAPWKCQFCSKVFQSVSGMKKHVAKKHSRRKNYQSPDQGCKQEGKDGTEVTSSGTTQGGQEVCRRCKVRFFAFGSGNKCAHCIHCNKELSLEGNDNWSGFEDVFVSSVVQDKMQSPRQKKNGQPLASARAFQCQYCQKGVSKINSLYKHIMIAHGKEFGSNDHGSCTRFGNKSERNDNSIHQACAAKASIKAFQNCEGHRVAKNLNARPRGVKFTTVRRNAGTQGKKHTVQECYPRNKAFPCEYCPKQFLQVTSRYRHVMLAHTGVTNAFSKVCQLKLQVPADKTSEAMSFCSDRSITSPSTLLKRKTDVSNVDDQPEKKKFRADDVNCGSCDPAGMWSFNRQTVTSSKAFPCEFCGKRFSTFSLQYKHFILVHSGSQAIVDQGVMDSEAMPAVKVSELSDSFNSACSESASSCSHGDPKRRHIFPSQRNIHRNGSSDSENCLKTKPSVALMAVTGPSVVVTTSEPYKCEICCTPLRTKSEWSKHFDEIHYGYTGESLCNVKRLPRQPLRTITWSLQSKNNLRPLRKRHVPCPEVTCGKQDEVSSMCPRKCKSKKRFKCEICHSLFTQKRSVLRHMNSRHNEEKPFHCAICGYATKRKDHLSAHVERSHFRKGKNCGE